MPDHSVTFVLRSFDREDRNLRFADFVGQCEALRKALVHTESAVTKRAERLDWQVVRMTYSSPATITVEPELPEEQADFPDHRSRVVRRFLDNWHALSEEKRVPEDLDRQALDAYKAVSGYVRKGRIRATISTGELPSVEVSGDVERLIDHTLEQETTVMGSVKGTLEYLNIHAHSRDIRIYPKIGPDRVVGRIPRQLVQKAGEAMGREVRATGELTYRARDNFPAYIQVRQLEVLPRDEDLPSMMEIKGIAPNLTGGKSSEAFVRELRNGEEQN